MKLVERGTGTRVWNSRLALVVGLAACGPGQIAMTGDVDDTTTAVDATSGTAGIVTTGGTSTSGGESTGTTTGSPTGGVVPTSGGSSGLESGSGTSTGAETTATTDGTSTTDGASTTGTTETPDGTTETTGGPCPDDAIECIGDVVHVCDGMGGHKLQVNCSGVNSGCEDGIGCVSDCDLTYVAPGCASGYPRIMMIVDASSSMLNLAGFQRAPEGMGGWDQFRDAFASNWMSLLTSMVPGGTLEERSFVGLTVFGHDVPDESAVLVGYGPCHQDVIAWALDPLTSCAAPGCVDPYADSPVAWTFVQADAAFGEPVRSHMPTCAEPNDPQVTACVGSGTFVHLGLARVQAYLEQYKVECVNDPAAPCDAASQFINILVMDGAPNSSEAAYAGPLTAMFEQGVVTHVIGFGDLVDTPMAEAALAKLAGYGSGGALMYHDADNQAELGQALAAIVAGVEFPPC